MLGLHTLLVALYIFIGLTAATLYAEHHPGGSVSKTCALLLFWPIVCIRYIFIFFKLAFKGLKEWFK